MHHVKEINKGRPKLSKYSLFRASEEKLSSFFLSFCEEQKTDKNFYAAT